MKIQSYKGYDIDVDQDGMFTAFDRDRSPVAKGENIKIIQDKLSELSKKKLGQIVYINQYRSLVKGKVTSILERRKWNNTLVYRVQIYDPETGSWNRWGEHTSSELIKDTSKNADIIKLITEAEERIKQEEKKISELYKAAEYYTDKELYGGDQ